MSKIIFMGTPQFACPALSGLIEAGHHVSLVLCQPDKRQGRGHQIKAPPVKQLALQHQIEVFQPTGFQPEAVRLRLNQEQADFFVVIAYGRILPQAILNLPKYGSINVHASLLPQLRGAAPIQYSLLLGHVETGVCTMLMDKGMDTGDLLLCEKMGIAPHETFGALSDQLSHLGAKTLLKTLSTFEQITPQPQDHSSSSYTKLIQKSDCILNWDQPAQEIYNRFRALSPSPGVKTSFRSKTLKIIDCIPCDGKGTIGKVLHTDTNGIIIATRLGALQIKQLQPQSKAPMHAKSFINGYQVQTGEQFGDL